MIIITDKILHHIA